MIYYFEVSMYVCKHFVYVTQANIMIKMGKKSCFH